MFLIHLLVLQTHTRDCCYYSHDCYYCGYDDVLEGYELGLLAHSVMEGSPGDEGCETDDEDCVVDEHDDIPSRSALSVKLPILLRHSQARHRLSSSSS